MTTSHPSLNLDQLIASLPSEWNKKLSPIQTEANFQKLIHFLNQEYSAGKKIYPAPESILCALQDVDLPLVKVVILGQDPYHGEGQAIGRSFAVPNHFMPKPPSLKNIFKELISDLGDDHPLPNSDLSSWAKQGVLLLNTVLTVEDSQPLSHRERGWEDFSKKLIQILNERDSPLIFVLWGNQAQAYRSQINSEKHFVIEAPHPSPLSAHRGFLGSKPFSKINDQLIKTGQEPIQW